MITLEVRSCIIWHLLNQTHICPDFGKGEDLSEFLGSQDDLYLQVELEIGEKDVDGASLFSILIVSVKALKIHNIALNDKKEKYQDKSLVVNSLPWSEIEDKLTEIIDSCQDYSYSYCVENLLQHFNWEYEGMK